MPIDWLGPTRPYGVVVGKAPQIRFEAGDAGVELRIHNRREETIIVESISATPPILGFSAGGSLEDVARPLVAQRQVPSEHALIVLAPGADATVAVIPFDPFSDSKPDEIIKVTLLWRCDTRKMLTSVTLKVSVRDIRDLQKTT